MAERSTTTGFSAEDRSVRKVLMTADTVGGVFRYAILLASELARRGVRVVLATMGPPASLAQRAAAAAVPGLSLHESRYALEWMDEPWDDVQRAGDWLLELERREAPDLLHLNGYCHAALPFSAPALVVAHSCVLSWWRAVLREEAPHRYDRYREHVARGIAAADAVAAPTRAMLSAIEEHYGPVRRGLVVPNAARVTARSVAKESIVLSAGRLWDDAKNARAVAAAAVNLDWPVYIAGSDVHPDGSRRSLAGISPLGFLDHDDLGRWMARASIFVLPARYEPFGLVALEAALSGCALVLGDIPSLREVWGDAAVFVDPDDSVGLTRVLRALMQHGGTRFGLAARTRRHAERFTPERMVDDYLALYTSLTELQTARSTLPCV